MGLFCERRRRWPKSKERGRSERYTDGLLVKDGVLDRPHLMRTLWSQVIIGQILKKTIAV